MTTFWTVGHSTRSLDELIAALRSFDVQLLADIRRFPASRRHPHFAIDPLKRGLFQAGIGYEYLGDELGGFRKTSNDSPNLGLENKSFRGYADWTRQPLFLRGAERLLTLATERRVAYMCAERHPSSCHRRILSDYLALARGCTIVHILDAGSATPHEPTRTVGRQGSGILYAPGPSLKDFGSQ